MDMNINNLTDLRKLLASDIKLEILCRFVEAKTRYEISNDEFAKALKLILAPLDHE